MKPEDLIQLALDMRNDGICSKKIMRMCIFISVLFAADTDYSLDQMHAILERIFVRTINAINNAELAEYLGKNIDEC